MNFEIDRRVVERSDRGHMERVIEEQTVIEGSRGKREEGSGGIHPTGAPIFGLEPEDLHELPVATYGVALN
jgi:hypothetical protein